MLAARGDEVVRRGFIPLILQTIAATDTAQRKLAARTDISKSRLEVLLHSNPEERSPMTLDEFQMILPALDGLDGSEARTQWAHPLQKAVLKRLAEEVLAVTQRRGRLAQSDDFRI